MDKRRPLIARSTVFPWKGWVLTPVGWLPFWEGSDDGAYSITVNREHYGWLQSAGFF